MKKSRKKRLLSSFLASIIALTVICPNLTTTVHAQVDKSSLTVTAGSSQTATFTHNHKNSGSITTQKIQANTNVTGATASGYCYTTKVQHSHEGNTTSGGNCYQANPHQHTESCYPHHAHTDSCKNYVSRYEVKGTGVWSRYIIEDAGGAGWTCPKCGKHWNYLAFWQAGGYTVWQGFDTYPVTDPLEGKMWYDNQNKVWCETERWGCCTAHSGNYWNGTYKCGYSAGQRTSNTPVCGKTGTTEGYVLKSTDPYYTAALYKNSCGISDGAVIAKITVSADNNNVLSLSVSNVNSKASYSGFWTKPDGTIVNGGTSLQCDEVGTYKYTVTVKTTINNQIVDNDTAVFSYTSVPHDTTVNFYDYDNSLLLSTTMKRGSELSSIQAPTKTGYTFTGFYYNTSYKYYDANGNNVVGKFVPLNGGTVNLYANYTANPYKVYYNTNEADPPSTILNVTYDSNYALPTASVNAVPNKSGYTFDGWYDTTSNVKVFNTDGSPVSNPYKYDHDITVSIRYHKNNYTVYYNDTDIEDDNLNQSQVVVFDTQYLPINQAPYKTGYVFDGHKLEGTVQFIWDGHGDIIHAVWDYVCGTDGNSVNAVKSYSPKTFNVDIGNDFDGDGVIDSIEETRTATFDSTFFDLDVPAYINGYTFDGWLLLENNTWIATYDYDSDTLTKTNDTWTWDDNVNWVNEPHSNFTLVRRWHSNTYTVNYNNTETSDINLDKSMNIVYNTSYLPIDIAPYKTGYVFDGTYIKDSTNTEEQIWNNLGECSRSVFDYNSEPKDGTNINAYKKYSPKTFDIEIGDDYDEDGVLDNVDYTETATYDSTFFDLVIPSERIGLTFDGYYILGTDICVAKYVEETGLLMKTSDTWIYDDHEDWNNNPTHNTLIKVESRWTHNEIEVTVNTETSDKIDDGVGNASEYRVDVTTRIEHYDRAYDGIEVPSKRGYTFVNYIVKPKNDTEEEVIFKTDGTAELMTFLWTGTVDPKKVTIEAVFTKNDISGTFDFKKFNPKTKEITDTPYDVNEVYDEPYHNLSDFPQKEGYDYNKIVDKDGNTVWDIDGNPVQEVWQYIDSDIEDFKIIWTPKTYTLTWNNGTKEQEITYGEVVPNIDTMGKTGYTFSGYSFDFFGTETFIFNGSGEFTTTAWLFDVGDSGTKIPLKDLYNANKYIVTVKTSADEFYEVEVIYDMAYNNVEIPLKTGYIFDGFVNEYNAEYPEELSEDFWFMDGSPANETYTYAHDITVLAKWTPKVFYLHCGDTVITVTYGEAIPQIAPTSSKNAYSDNDYDYSYAFSGWSYNGTQIFNEYGLAVMNLWTIDLGENGTHIYLSDDFSETKTEIPKPESPKPVYTPVPTEPEVETEMIEEIVRPLNSGHPFGLDDRQWETVKKVAVTTGVTISGTLLLIGICLLILFILFLLGEITLVYVYDERTEKKKLKGIAKIQKYKKKDRTDEIKYFVRLAGKPEKKYYYKLLDTRSQLISIRLAPHWVDRQNLAHLFGTPMIRISCKELYDDFGLKSVKTKKGDMDRGFIEIKLEKTYNS